MKNTVRLPSLVSFHWAITLDWIDVLNPIVPKSEEFVSEVPHWSRCPAELERLYPCLQQTPESHRLCCCSVACVQFCFGGPGCDNALLLCPGSDQMVSMQDHASTDRFSQMSVCVSKGVQGVWITLPLKEAPDSRLYSEEPTNPLHILHVLSVRPRHL